MSNNNPAKAYLRRYRAALKRAESLQRAIDEAHDRAINISVALKPDKVQTSSNGDALEMSVIRAVEATERLEEELQRANQVLCEVLTAIGAVPDEMQKTVLTLRYVEGLDWLDVQEKIGYEKTQTLVIHGRALLEVNRWMKVRTKTD